MKKHLFFGIFALLIAQSSFAEIYKHVDADGRVTYSNIKSKGAVRLEIDADPNATNNPPASTKKLHQISALQHRKAFHASLKIRKMSVTQSGVAFCKPN